MIPIALSGDRSYNKDNVRRYLMEGGRVIPGASTIHFDEISRKRIFAAVDNANFSDINLIKDNYLNLRNKLGRIPRLKDFDDYGEMDVLRIFDNKRLSIGLGILIILQIIILTTGLSKFFIVSDIGIKNVLIVLGICLMAFILGEFIKPIYVKLFKDYMEEENGK